MKELPSAMQRPHGFPGDASHHTLWADVREPVVSPWPAARDPGRPLSLCIVTPDIAGPIRNGGIGTACAAIAQVWADAGHQVTILYTLPDYTEGEPVGAWVKRYAAKGITFVPCPAAEKVSMPWPMQRAWDAWRWLRGRRFDLVYFPEWTGGGAYALAARHLGLDFQDTRMIVGTHSPTLWHVEGNQRLPLTIEPLSADAAERAAVAMADAVVSPSRYLLSWLGAAGWKMPAACHVLFNPVPAFVQAAPLAPRSAEIRELVFFGRLEARKGLLLFLRAVKLLDPALRPDLRVTFLGKPGDVPGGALNAIAAARPEGIAGWETLTDLDAAGALKHLAQPGRVAVMPSLVENSPMTVLECLHQGLPFLAAEVGGIPELLREEDRATHLFAPTPPALAAALARVLRDGLLPALPAARPEDIAADWRALALAYGAAEAPPAPVEPPATPLVSVVLVTRNRPAMLAQALDGLRAQTWPCLEVVLVDDGSDRPDAIAALDRLEPEFAERGWRIIRQPNRYLGAARNAGWRAARGDFIIFHDDDNISMPRLVETYLRAAQHSGADILTAAMAVFEGDAPPEGGVPDALEVFPPLGNAPAIGLYHNLFGDAHACFRRAALEALGGFTEDFGVGHEDWELFARANLEGHAVFAVPEPLFWYRISKDSMLRSRATPDPDLLRSARPYLALLPPQVRWSLALGLALAWRPEAPPDHLGARMRQLMARMRAFAARPFLGLPIRLCWRLVRPIALPAMRRFSGG
jgi:glycosyltransferase involved in cell wall biosynthesis/GT2 family glycosyltransferase